MPDLLRRIYHEPKRGQSIDVLVAIGDRISQPPYRIPHMGSGKKTIYNEARTRDGISVLILDSNTAAPDLWAHEQDISKKTPAIVQGPYRLSFQFQRPATHEFLAGKEHENVRRPFTTMRTMTIELPIANTLFHNGQEATIRAERWVVGETILESKLACIKRSRLKAQTVRLGAPIDKLVKSFKPVAPLTMIGRRRTVAAAMGNVVRRFYIEGVSGPDEPASKELEDSVAQFFSDRGEDMQTLSIWALVGKSTTAPPGMRNDLGRLLLRGAHLHRVLSGGGGWGNKQGLLSLDPEQDFNGASNTSPFDSEDLDTGTGPSFGQTVSPGDVISFWMGPLANGSPEQSIQPAALDGSWEIHKIRKSFIFGTAPSTMDNRPSGAPTPPEDSKPQDYTYVGNQFCMLSEKGWTLSFEPADGHKVQTKIDAPSSAMVVGGRGEQPLMKRVEIADEDEHLDPRIQKIIGYNTYSNPKARLKATRNARKRSGTPSEPSSEYLTAVSPKSTTQNTSKARSLKEAVAHGTTHSVLSGLETWRAKDLENPPTKRNLVKIKRHPSTPANLSFRKVEPESVWRAKREAQAELMAKRALLSHNIQKCESFRKKDEKTDGPMERPSKVER